MKIVGVILFTGLLYLVYMVLFSDEAGELLPTLTEIKLYTTGEFQSGVCRSPDLSPHAPYWRFNGTHLNEDEINRRYGAIVTRNSDEEGHHLSTLLIPFVNLTLNASIISCLVGSSVILRYHLTVVETELVYLPTEQFAASCVSPYVASLGAPLFKFNDIVLNSVSINELYQATVTRNSSLDGHHQAVLTIIALNLTLNDSIVTCMVNSTVIWRVHLIIIGSKDNPHTTTAAMESSATTDGVTQTAGMPELSKSAGLSEVSKRIITVTATCVLLVVLGVVIILTVILAYIYKRRRNARTSGLEYDSNNNDGPPDVPAPSQPPTIPIVPQVPDSESQGPPVTTEPVTGICGSGRTPRHTRVLSLLRCSGSIDEPADSPALDTTTSTYLHSLNNSFSIEVGQDESEMLQLSMEEESRSEGRSLPVPCINGNNCKNVYESFVKGWDNSSRQCQYVANGISDEHNNNGKVACSAV